MSEEELARKFMKLVAPVVGSKKADDLAGTIDKLETFDRVGQLVRQLEVLEP